MQNAAIPRLTGEKSGFVLKEESGI